MVEKIAYIEQCRDQNVELDRAASHSFEPEEYPRHVSQRTSEAEHRQIENAQQDEIVGCLDDDVRYLICHYFDFICGTSTGS